MSWKAVCLNSLCLLSCLVASGIYRCIHFNSNSGRLYLCEWLHVCLPSATQANRNKFTRQKSGPDLRGFKMAQMLYWPIKVCVCKWIYEMSLWFCFNHVRCSSVCPTSFFPAITVWTKFYCIHFIYLFISWQIPIILSENQWCPTFSVARETALPFPAWQLIRLWKTCSWKHVPVKLWPLVSSFLPAWSKASLSTTHRSPTRAVMSAQEGWKKLMSDHMTTTSQWGQVTSSKLHARIPASIIFFFAGQRVDHNALYFLLVPLTPPAIMLQAPKRVILIRNESLYLTCNTTNVNGNIKLTWVTPLGSVRHFCLLLSVCCPVRWIVEVKNTAEIWTRMLTL